MAGGIVAAGVVLAPGVTATAEPVVQGNASRRLAGWKPRLAT